MARDNALEMMISTLLILSGIIISWAVGTNPIELGNGNWMLILIGIAFIYCPTVYWYVRATSSD